MAITIGTSILLAILSAVLLILAFPKADLEILAWVGLVPLLVAIKEKALPAAYLLGFVTGLLFFGGFFYWVWVISAFNLLDFILLELYFAHYLALFGCLLTLITRRTQLPIALTAPVLWVSLEYLRAHFFFLALPMALLGHSQYRQLPLIQIASVTGVYGLSFLVVMVNATLSELLRFLLDRQAWRSLMKGGLWAWTGPFGLLLMAILSLGGSVLYGFGMLSREQAEDRLKVGVVQRNIPPERNWDVRLRTEILHRYLELSRQAAGDSPVLIVWPETAISAPLRTTPDLLSSVTHFARATHSYLLVGSAESRKFSSPAAPRQEQFNSAFLISPRGGLEGVYHKIRLVPFGEYVPLKRIFTWPSWLMAGGNDLTPGKDYVIFHLPTAQFGVLLCWEALFPNLFRAFAQRGPQFMVNITNEAWFGKTAASYHLAAISLFRAVEHRIALVRSANGGRSLFIDPYGRITGQVQDQDQRDLFAEGALTRAIVLSSQRTFYTRYGDLFAYLCIGMTGLVMAHALRKR
jgi:apolipoprotein N-acyltransferase